MDNETATQLSSRQARGGTAVQGSRACLRACAETMLIYCANLEVFNLTDVERLGYTESTAKRAIKALLDWGAVRRAAKHAYLISPETKARFLREVAVSQARARIVLLEAFGMEGWDEERVEAFLEGFRDLWRKRRSVEETSPNGAGGASPRPTVDRKYSAANC